MSLWCPSCTFNYVIKIVNLSSQIEQHGSLGRDIGNAYLEAITREKVYIVAGPEFEEIPGHRPVIHKAYMV